MAYGKAGDWYINNVEGGGGSWQTVFEGSVTTESESTFASGDIVGLSSLDGDSVKVTFNGVEYTLPKHELGYGEMGEGNTPDFSNYPLFIETSDTPYMLYTETAGTYTLKIEEPQSGGSSDFSIATVTVNANTQFEFYVPLINDEFGYLGAYDNINPGDSKTLTVGLYKGKAVTQFHTSGVVSVSGNAQLNDDQILITGDCTVTIS